MSEKKKGQGKTVLIGMTGRIDSGVAAYLLKKQGFQCIGASLIFYETDEFIHKLFERWSVRELEKIKAICDVLEMPFYGISAIDEYKDQVLDPVIAARLAGHNFVPSISTNKILIEILCQKAKKVGADYIATGHYAKIFHDQRTNQRTLMVANGLENDQTYELAAMKQEHMAKLLLPLAEMRKQEVEKVASLIPAKFLPRVDKIKDDVMSSPNLATLVEKLSPKSLRKEGTIFKYSDDSVLADHTGTYQYHVGQNKISGKGGALVDNSLYVVDINCRTGNIYADFIDKARFTHAIIRRMWHNENLNLATPLSAFVKVGEKNEKIACTVDFKNNGHAIVEFNQEQSGILQTGQYVVFYDKKTTGAHVLGAGYVAKSGILDDKGFEIIEKEKEEEEVNEQDELERQARDIFF